MHLEFQVLTTSTHVVFVQEFAANGDLLEFIIKRGIFPEEQAKLKFRQLIEALVYLQQKNILHRDIKCENLFLDDCYNIKLGDFSESSPSQSSSAI